MYGTFEFHGSSVEIEDGYCRSYEAPFTRGELDAILFLNDRGSDSRDRPEFAPDDSDVVRF